MMTRKIFEKTASILRKHREDLVYQGYPEIELVSLAGEFADMFKQENSRFNRARFMDAIYKEE